MFADPDTKNIFEKKADVSFGTPHLSAYSDDSDGGVQLNLSNYDTSTKNPTPVVGSPNESVNSGSRR